MTDLHQDYVPGTCNIGRAEIARRARTAWGGLLLLAALWVLFYVYHVGAGWRLFLFLPAAASAMGFLQTYMRFCVAFGSRGIYNFGPAFGTKGATVQVVQDEESKKKDRAKSLRMMAYALLIGVVIAIVAFFTTS